MSLQGSDPPTGGERRFLSVAQVAELFGTSNMTVYRAISAGELPAVRMRGRLIVPRQAIDDLVRKAVDAADAAAGHAIAGHLL